MDTTLDRARTLKIAIVTGTRPGRLNEAVAHWVLDVAHRRGDVHVSLVDVGEHRLRLDTATLPRLGRYAPEHLHAWSRTVAAFDGFVFVTPEYNEASSAVLKQAINLVARDWRNKAAGFVGYGAQGAVGAVEDLRQALVAVGAATVAPQVSLTLVPGFWKPSSFMPDARHAPDMQALLEQVITWARALQTVRVAVGQERDPTAPVTRLRLDDMRFHAQ
ncbi:MAG: NADPH-dependent FMN reductase [Burkholderiaceae bacterium]